MENNTADKPLREDVKLLGDLLGQVIIEQEGKEVFDNIEQIRKYAKQAVSGDQTAQKELVNILCKLDSKQILPITKAFSQFLNFANIAEQYHRIRRTRWHQLHPDNNAHQGSLDVLLPTILQQDISKEDLFQQIVNSSIDLVLTAHPTEVKRRTIMLKYEKISKALAKLDRNSFTPLEKEKILLSLKQEMTSVWQTREVRSHNPTAVDEAKWCFAIIENSLWHALPSFMRNLDLIMQTNLGQHLPINANPIKFSSWMGGDRDGNPNVTPDITRKVCYMARWVAVDLLIKEITPLRDSLSMKIVSKEFAAKYPQQAKKEEPYRSLLIRVLKRLQITKDWLSSYLNPEKHKYYPEQEVMYQDTAELLEPLQDCYYSLLECKGDQIARDKLLDVIRQLNCFGLQLIKLDIRQEAEKHTVIMDKITQAIAVGKYSEWSENQRQRFLITELESQRPLIPHSLYNDPELYDVLGTFKVLAEIPRECLGSYVISMAAQPSDVLLVALLQKEVGITDILPVVPLFETSSDLERAPLVIDQLLNVSPYRKLINNYQQVMIGYSDSAKDIGLMAGSWEQYRAQEKILQVADGFGVSLEIFHGRGGSIGRGGWPTYEAILSQPPGTIRGKMRVTQQGEVITNRFGIQEIAMRTMDLYLSSSLEATLFPPPEPKDSWRALMNDISRISSSVYRTTVQENQQFLEYFYAATPISELEDLAIGSRPSRRRDSNSIADLRAISWVFAWTQNRLLLPAWIGVGTALRYAIDTKRFDEITEMRQQWPFFHTMLSMCEMVLAKADSDISLYYDEKLVASNLRGLGEELRSRYARSCEVLIKVLKHDKLLGNNESLSRSIQVRNPYPLPLHLLQVELLQRVRDNTSTLEPEVKQALLVSIAGIAAGMRNTG